MMCFEKNCYFCKHLSFFDMNNVSDYFCTLTGVQFHNPESLPGCDNFFEDVEE